MNSVTHFGQRIIRRISCWYCPVQRFCDCSVYNDGISSGLKSFEDLLKESSDFDPAVDVSYGFNDDEHGFSGVSPRRRFFEDTRRDADRIFEVLRQVDLNVKSVMDELNIRVSGLVVREVLLKILRSINYQNRSRCARLAYNFFMWSGQRIKYKHTLNSFHLVMKIFGDCGEFKAMWKLFNEMIEHGYHVTARTLNILICSLGKAGLERPVVERLIKSKTFNFRQHKHCYNAILHSLLAIKQYKLIEWVYQQMLAEPEHFSPDILTYNILIWTKYRLGKTTESQKLLDEMTDNGYTVASELEKAQQLFKEMIVKGQLPNVFTYNSMICGLCLAGKFAEACSMLNEMEYRGCTPNFLVYSTLVNHLQKAHKLSEAHEVIRDMLEKGRYVHLLSKFKRYRRC
ncbi:hypothetical protein Ancab_009643 [Ancistrocladus abbreviatus]